MKCERALNRIRRVATDSLTPGFLLDRALRDDDQATEQVLKADAFLTPAAGCVDDLKKDKTRDTSEMGK